MSRSAERLCGYLDGHILTGRLRLPDPFFYQLDANRQYEQLELLGLALSVDLGRAAERNRTTPAAGRCRVAWTFLRLLEVLL